MCARRGGRRAGGAAFNRPRASAAAGVVFIVALSLTGAASQSASPANISYPGLAACAGSSLDLSGYGADDALAPCVIYDVRDPEFASGAASPLGNGTAASAAWGRSAAEVALVQVTPSSYRNHRDGAVTAVRQLNGANGGAGLAVGYNRDHFVKFRLISIIGGNHLNIGNDAYGEAHAALLDSVLAEVDNARFIIGSYSGVAVADRAVALARKTVVISQVGPPGFYRDVATNPYIFGIHVNSDTYPLPALQALLFHLNSVGTPTSQQSVGVIYRTKSEFFYSTCRSAIDEATAKGFNVTAVEYDPDGDEDLDGVPNSQDVPYLYGLADLLCPHADDGGDRPPPAIFACVTNGEADAILARLRANGCRPSLAWFTTATWAWAADNPDVVPYFQGGGQWHKNFRYSDGFFETGQDVLDYGLAEFGYAGDYNHVVSYTIPNLIARLLEFYFDIKDFPDVSGAFVDRYEELRRALTSLQADTIFGLVNFDQYQRNIGRGAAGMQWIKKQNAQISSAGGEEQGASAEFVLGCMSPLDQADTSTVIPSPSGYLCLPGSHIDRTLIETGPALLGDKCASCTADSYMGVLNDDMRCTACPAGSGTAGEIGATSCVQEQENLRIPALRVMGCLFVAISWALAFSCIGWIYVYRRDPVVRIGQPEFLFMICAGAILSTSAIIPLTLAEAGAGEDTAAATRCCQAIPFLYSLGWVLMYSSLTAKSYRMVKIFEAADNLKRKNVAAKQMYIIIIAFLLLDLIVLVAWQVTDPLTYVRREVGRSAGAGVVTVNTVGECTSGSLWVLFVVLGIHVCLMVVTNAFLWRVRNIVSDRYQEQKYVGVASVYICELILLGLPILYAVQDSGAAQYIVLAGVIFLTDTGVLSFVFIPKIRFQKKGIPEGVSVMQSIQSSHRRSSRDLDRRSLKRTSSMQHLSQSSHR